MIRIKVQSLSLDIIQLSFHLRVPPPLNVQQPESWHWNYLSSHPPEWPSWEENPLAVWSASEPSSICCRLRDEAKVRQTEQFPAVDWTEHRQIIARRRSSRHGRRQSRRRSSGYRETNGADTSTGNAGLPRGRLMTNTRQRSPNHTHIYIYIYMCSYVYNIHKHRQICILSGECRERTVEILEAARRSAVPSPPFLGETNLCQTHATQVHKRQAVSSATGGGEGVRGGGWLGTPCQLLRPGRPAEGFRWSHCDGRGPG